MAPSRLRVLNRLDGLRHDAVVRARHRITTVRYLGTARSQHRIVIRWWARTRRHAQTVEAIQHAQAAKVPIVVRSTRWTSRRRTPRRLRQTDKYGVIPEEWGGENIFVPVSAKTGLGVDQLLDSI